MITTSKASPCPALTESKGSLGVDQAQVPISWLPEQVPSQFGPGAPAVEDQGGSYCSRRFLETAGSSQVPPPRPIAAPTRLLLSLGFQPAMRVPGSLLRAPSAVWGTSQATRTRGVRTQCPGQGSDQHKGGLGSHSHKGGHVVKNECGHGTSTPES